MTSAFEKLEVWQLGRKLAILVYKITENFPEEEKFGLINQMRRSAVSVPSNIAEGDERSSNKDTVRFFFMAKGSLAELRTQLMISLDLRYIDKIAFEKINDSCVILAKKLGALIKKRQE